MLHSSEIVFSMFDCAPKGEINTWADLNKWIPNSFVTPCKKKN